MSESFALTLIGIAVILSVRNWRTGILISVVVGFLADPVRKLVPGEPVYLSSIVLVVVAATMLGARRRGLRLGLRPIYSLAPGLRLPLVLFVLLVVAQSLHAFLNTGSPVIAAIGLIAYLAPIPGVLLGYYYARSLPDLSRFLKWYIALVLLMAAGIYADRLGFDGRALQSVGKDLITYSRTGGAVTLVQGFFRAPEIAAWHIAMGLSFLLLLVLTSRRTTSFALLSSVLCSFLAGALIFTGRRKGLVEVVMFLVVYTAFLAYFRKGALRAAIALSLLALGGLVVVTVVGGGRQLGIQPYIERGTTIGSAEAARVPRMSVEALKYVIRRNGILGAGAGTGSQGAQHFGGGSAIVGSAAEGGVGKIVAELGIPGLLFFLWLVAVAAHHVWRVSNVVARGGPARAGYAFGLVAFLIANALTFTIGHQVFGDPFVLYVIGIMTGFLLATPYLVERPRPDPRAPYPRVRPVPAPDP